MPSIINSDDGVVSGSSGLKTTGGNDGILNLQSNGATIAALSGGAFQVGGNNISAQNSMGFRNRLINGNMVIDQRNAGASVTPTVDAQYGSCDRWSYFLSQASKFSVQQNAGSVTPPAGFTNYLGITSLSAYTLTGNDNFEIVQKVEGFNSADLGWGTANAQAITLSFWVRSSLTGTFGGGISNSAYNRSYPFAYTINAANTWEQKTITIPGDTSGTWLTNNGLGLVLQLALGATGSRLGTAGAWAAGWFPSVTGAVSVVSTNGATFYITGVQLEAGSVATPFERIDYGRQLIQCQRYYQQIQNMVGIGQSGSSTIVYSSIALPVEMRATPSLSQSGVFSFEIPFGTGSTQSSASVSIASSGSSGKGIYCSMANFSGLTGGQMYMKQANTNTLNCAAEL